MGGRLLGLRSLRFLDSGGRVIPGSAFLAKTHRGVACLLADCFELWGSNCAKFRVFVGKKVVGADIGFGGFS